MENIFQDNVLFVLLFLIILYAVALICTTVLFITIIAKKWDSREALRINMLIKLIQVPAYLIIFIIGLACLLTIFTLGFSIILFILDIMTIFLTGLIGVAGIKRAHVENKLSTKAATKYGISQFIFCADVISAILVYRKVKEK